MNLGDLSGCCLVELEVVLSRAAVRRPIRQKGKRTILNCAMISDDPLAGRIVHALAERKAAGHAAYILWCGGE